MAAADESNSLGLTPNDSQLIGDTFAWMRATMGEDAFRIGDNDWTQIVKLHAMIETALNDALIKHFQAPELSRVISKLETSNTATGKVAFAKALQMLRPETTVFIQKMSELRNFCVHDVRNFKFDLDKYLASLSDEKRNELMKPISKMIRPEQRATTTPQTMLFIGTMCVMFELQMHRTKLETRHLTEKMHQLQSELYERARSNPTKE